MLAYCCSRGLLLASVVGQAHCCSVVIVNNKNSVQLPTFGSSSHRVVTAPDHAVTLRFKAGRALDAQEAGLDHFGDGRPSNAD